MPRKRNDVDRLRVGRFAISIAIGNSEGRLTVYSSTMAVNVLAPL